MATSSLLGVDRAPTQKPGHSTGALGPSDSSDSGSDMQGGLKLETDDDFDGMSAAISGAANTALDSDSDASGTGDRGSAFPEHVREAGDISPDRIGRIGDSDSDSDTFIDPMSPDELSLSDMAQIAVDKGLEEEELSEDEYETPLG